MSTETEIAIRSTVNGESLIMVYPVEDAPRISPDQVRKALAPLGITMGQEEVEQDGTWGSKFDLGNLTTRDLWESLLNAGMVAEKDVRTMSSVRDRSQEITAQLAARGIAEPEESNEVMIGSSTILLSWDGQHDDKFVTLHLASAGKPHLLLHADSDKAEIIAQTLEIPEELWARTVEEVEGLPSMISAAM